MRRLPVYFLIDVSESMVGEPIDQVQEGISNIIKELRTDPYALETVFVSIIAFAGKAEKISNLVELYNYYPPKLPIGGGTGLGYAIDFLMNDMEISLKKTTMEEKGDWKPIIFLFTDGRPTDKVDIAFDKWNQKYRNKSNLIAISIGDNTDTKVLSRIAENVLQLNKTDNESFKQFFKWVTASIKTTSISVSAMNDDGLNLAPLTNGYLEKIDLSKNTRPLLDENFVVILAKCQTTKKSYLIKYQKRLSPSEFKEIASTTLDYKLVGAFPIDNSYYKLCDNTQSTAKINTGELVGFPSCPCCSNQYGFSFCSCGNVLCTGDEETTKCPWCETEAHFSLSDASANVNRTRG